MKHIVFLTVMPSPYQREFFHALNASKEFTINVLYYTGFAHDREWLIPELAEYEEIMPGFTLKLLGPGVHYNPGVIKRLQVLNPDIVVVSDYSALTAQIVMRWLIRQKKTWVYWGERPGMTQAVNIRTILRTFMMNPLRSASAIAGIGSQAVEVYRNLPGIKQKKYFNIPYYCDTTAYEKIARNKQDSNDKTSILFSGQFIKRKGLDILLEAFFTICNRTDNVELVLMGHGDDLEKMLQPYLAHKSFSKLRVVGYIDPSSLPGYFAAADIFVLPSRHDGWGLVINEALAARLPIISTRSVGAACDYIKDGENGFLLNNLRTDELVEKLGLLISSAALREQFSNQCQKCIPSIRLEDGVNRWIQLVKELS